MVMTVTRRRLLTIDVMERAGSSKDGAEDIKRHKWFQGVDWDNIQLKKRKVRGGDDGDVICRHL